MTMLLTHSDETAEAFLRMFRSSARVDARTSELLAKSHPLLHLGLIVPEAMPVVARYRSARATMLAHPSKIAASEMEAANRELRKFARKTDTTLSKAVEREVTAWESFFDTLMRKPKNVDLPPAAVTKRLLDDDHRAIFTTFSRDLMHSDDPMMAELKQAWAQYVRVVGLENESEWALLLSEVQKAAAGIPFEILENGTGWRRWADQVLNGHISRIQGFAFEAYARRALEVLGESERMLREAMACKKKLGESATAFRVGGEIQLAYVGPNMKPDFKQFADDATLAMAPARKGQPFPEVDATSFLEFKAEGGPTALSDKLESFARRHAGGKDGSAVLLRFTDPNGKTVTALLRPRSSTEPLVYYAVGTSNTVIPGSTQLRSLGINQRNIALDLSRNDLRDLVTDLIWVAASLGR